jgi:hypothetical protein
MAEIQTTLGDLELLGLDDMPLSLGHDEFLEQMLNCIRNDVLSFQRYYFKSKTEQKKILSNELLTLKQDFAKNFNEIKKIENLLNTFQDKIMLAEVENFRHFELVNSEKITLEFVKIAKSTHTDFSLNEIKDDNGNHFASSQLREQFIVNYFKDIYKTPKCDLNREPNLIEKFLGPEICNSELVSSSKLNPDEMQSLEQPLSIQELDDAALSANKKSAPGLDGFSMDFILKFWKLFRIPLHRYSVTCFEKGILTSTFRSACVRLIPKKGDKSNIRNWQPISLLSNIYKIISRALNNRLKKFSNKIMSRAQKGFTDARFIQEVLINVVESIGYANAKNLPGAIISVDMAKAFDTICHRFLKECYEFFGFGMNFINMMETVGNSRQACIILDGGKYSGNSPLGSGRHQGEILSPFQYKICNQIFLFKLELDPRIKSLTAKTFGPRAPFPIECNSSPPNAVFRGESERETDKAEGFADDTTAITLAD